MTEAVSRRTLFWWLAAGALAAAAPALVASEWGSFWIYVLAPVIGALGGAFLYGLLRSPSSTTS